MKRCSSASRAGLAGGVAGVRHAGRLGLGQKLSDLQKLHRDRVLPLRASRQHGPLEAHREAVPRAGHARKDEAGDRRMPAQLLRSDGQGRGRGGDRRRKVGDLYRWRGRRACAQGRSAVHGGQRRGCADHHRSFHAVPTARTPNTRSGPTHSSLGSDWIGFGRWCWKTATGS